MDEQTSTKQVLGQIADVLRNVDPDAIQRRIEQLNRNKLEIDSEIGQLATLMSMYQQWQRDQPPSQNGGREQAPPTTSPTENEPASVSRAEMDVAILAVFDNNPREIFTGESLAAAMRAETNVDPNGPGTPLRAHLARLADDKKIERVERGKYIKAGWTEANPTLT